MGRIVRLLATSQCSPGGESWFCLLEKRPHSTSTPSVCAWVIMNLSPNFPSLRKKWPTYVPKTEENLAFSINFSQTVLYYTDSTIRIIITILLSVAVPRARFAQPNWKSDLSFRVFFYRSRSPVHRLVHTLINFLFLLTFSNFKRLDVSVSIWPDGRASMCRHENSKTFYDKRGF